ncbi:MAG TPA: penicillin acylase family protein, partial [Solirubrobacteraceae bacterium]|nr:penicillin acylase family protein [Solirubrobacteraceae bacterium]
AGVRRGVSQVTWNENLMAADDRGSIGWWHPGLLPLRPTGYDERLPYPGTGQAEWKGFLTFRQTPQVINPRQGWLANWNNLPSTGWTNGDAPADERLAGSLHRGRFLAGLVAAAAADPGYKRVRSIDRAAGSTAQQRPLLQGRLAAAARGATGNAAAVLNTLVAWDGDYVRTDEAGTVDPGVAAWDAFREAAQQIGVPKGAGPVVGSTSRSHQFDVTNGEAYALRTLDAAGYRRAAARAFSALASRFGSADPASWREPRRQYAVTAQGVASPPPLAFFDRGTWQQTVELGP